MSEQQDGQPPGPTNGSIPEEQALGDPIRVFRAKLLTSVLVGVCGVIIILLGIACFFTGLASLGAYPVVLGLFTLWIGYLLTQQRCLVCTGGVITVRFGNRQCCAWGDVREIVDTRITQGMVSSRVCTLVRKNGSRLAVRALGIGDFGALVGMLREQAQARQIPWKEERVTK